ncbi:hypothetical protein JB92DRAFT_3068214 [Gautieria morchelliformis]|nr:hypothetical protein JB92DRAFT_3068214 [Gautieria morchelliformis]
MGHQCAIRIFRVNREEDGRDQSQDAIHIQSHRLHFRRILRSERWALKLARDEVDGKMYKVAMQLMWYDPLLCGRLINTTLIIPIAVARFVDFSGNFVHFWLTIAADFLFNLNGFFNVLLFAATYRHIPLSSMPSLSAPRKSLHVTNYGITPFVLAAGDESKVVPPQTGPRDQDPDGGERTERRASVSTLDSFESADSTAPLTAHQKP